MFFRAAGNARFGGFGKFQRAADAHGPEEVAAKRSFWRYRVCSSNTRMAGPGEAVEQAVLDGLRGDAEGFVADEGNSGRGRRRLAGVDAFVAALVVPDVLNAGHGREEHVFARLVALFP